MRRAALFQAFIDGDGFAEAAWWEWPERRRPPDRPVWSSPNHPRESVSWFDAMAFCRWLDARLHERGVLSARETVTLPTEEMWEKAARGTDGREFPWGDGYRSGRANIDETWRESGPFYLTSTSAVGIYTEGVSPCGALDMAGNVWEWTRSAFRADAPAEFDGHGDAEAEALRVVRGGSWNYSQVNARASYRCGLPPDDRFNNLGCRLVVVSPIP